MNRQQMLKNLIPLAPSPLFFFFSLIPRPHSLSTSLNSLFPLFTPDVTSRLAQLHVQDVSYIIWLMKAKQPAACPARL